MKRALSLAMLLLGLWPAAMLPVTTDAASTGVASFERTCRRELGYSESTLLAGSQLYFLRRCMFTHQIAEEQMKETELIQQRYDQQFWRRYDIGQSILHESRRSLRDRIDAQETIRMGEYRSLSLQERADILERHRSMTRATIREKERVFDHEKKKMRDDERTMQERCRTYSGKLKYDCLRGEF